MKQPRIGIIDDEESVRNALAALLDENGFDPVSMTGGADFEALGEPPQLDLVLIDLKLRGESGLILAQKIRNTQNLPIVMLTGAGDETDKIVGLEIGADDYLLKPFNPRELIARIRAVLRRCTGQSIPPPTSDIYTEQTRFGQLSLDRTRRTVHTNDGSEITLTNAEYRLLDFFLSHSNQIISRVDLLTYLGNDLNRYMDRTIDVLILRLRRKIEANPSKPVHLQTRRGQGYIFIMETGTQSQ